MANPVTRELSRTIDTLLRNTDGKHISLEFLKTSRRVESTAEEINNEVARIFQISKINTAEFYWIKTCDRIQIIGWEGVEPHDIPFSEDSIYGNTRYELSLKNPEIRKRYEGHEETRKATQIFSTHKKIFESKEIPSGCELFPDTNMWIDGIE